MLTERVEMHCRVAACACGHQIRNVAAAAYLDRHPPKGHDALVGAAAQQAHLLPNDAGVHPRLHLKHLEQGSRQR